MVVKGDKSSPKAQSWRLKNKMATVIRFARHGTKKRPFYRIVVQDHRSPRDGKFIEHIGGYDPRKGDSTISVERARLEYWVGCGAIMSESVASRMKIVRKQWSLATPSDQTAVAPKVATKKTTAAKVSKTKQKEA